MYVINDAEICKWKSKVLQNNWSYIVTEKYKKLSYRRETARQLPTWREGG